MSGNQKEKRSLLSSKLKGMFRSDPKVSYKINVENGIFRVAMTKDEVIGYLYDEPVKSYKIAELDSDIQTALQENPEEAGALFLDELVTAHNEGKLQKEAGFPNDGQPYESKLQNITQKQLEHGGPLHDRHNEERTDITQKQLNGDYREYDHTKRCDEDLDSITEKQLDEKGNCNPDTSPREDHERSEITQAQLDKGEYTDVNARREYEESDITQKQLRRDWDEDEVKSITEKQLAGDEQKHDKVLIRRLASKADAMEFAKRVAGSAAKTIVANKLDAQEVLEALRLSVRNFKAQKRVAEILMDEGAEDLPLVVDEEVSPEGVADDVLGDEELTDNYEVETIVSSLKKLLDHPNFSSMLEEAMAGAEEAVVEEEPMLEDEEAIDGALDDFGAEDDLLEDDLLEDEALATSHYASGSDDDGLIAVEGEISEVDADVNNNEVFASTGFAYARKVAGTELPEEMVELRFEINEGEGLFRAVFATNEAATREKLAERSEARRQKVASTVGKLSVEAQMPPAGGGIPEVAPAGDPMGGGTTMPAGPADPTLGEPPMETFEDPMAGEEVGMEEDAHEPSPPGTICPVCGSDDVDVENGHFDCNSCSSEGNISVSMDVTSWAGTLEDAKGDEEGVEEGEGMEVEEGGEMPIAASVYTIGRKFVKQASNSGYNVYRVGGVCPNCGSDNTNVDGIGNGRCYSCSQQYISKIDKTASKGLVLWQPIPVKPDCPACEVEKLEAQASAKAEGLSKEAGRDVTEGFPMKECMEKMARRYGLNTVALSGACAGKPLADCVCTKMKTANRYSDGLMMKLANRLVEKDPMEECVEDHIREGLGTKAACEACETLKKKALLEYPEEDEVENVVDAEAMGIGEGFIYEVDNFEDDMFELGSEEGLGAQLRELIQAIHELVGTMGNDEESASDIIEDVDDMVEDYNGDDDIADYEDDGEDSIEFEDEGDDDDDDGDDDGPDNGGDLDDSDEDLDDESCGTFGGDEMQDEGAGCMSKDEDVNELDEKHGSDCECPECNCGDDKGQNSEKENKEEDNERGAYAETMSSKRIKRYNESDTLSTLTAAETMQINDLLGDRKISDTASEKEVKHEGSQDCVDKYQDGKTMGKEEKFDAKDPDVPARGNGSKLGEGESMPEGKAKVPAGEGAMGSESETIDTEPCVSADGIATSSSEKGVKTAGEKKVEDPKPVDQSSDLKKQTLHNGQGMGSEKEDGLTPDTLKDPDVPEDNQLMGPDESKDFESPKVPAGDGGMGGESETVGTEVSVETKGTVIAQIEAEAEAKVKEASVRAERIKLATRLAALELLDREITDEEYDEEVTKLASSSVQTLKTLIQRHHDRKARRLAEKSNVQRVEESFESNGGLETPLFLSKEANSSNLKDDIMGMFSLEQKLRSYEDDK
jgi:hypothetical protein